MATTTQTEKRIIEILGQIEPTFLRQLNQIERELTNIKKRIDSINSLGTGVLTTVIGVGALKTLQQMVDLTIALERTLKAVIPEYQDLEETQRNLLDLANETQSSLENTTRLYIRLTVATKDLGVQSEQVMKVVEGFNRVLVAGGASAREAEAASTQFGQALASGKLAGDEFRSLLEATPLLVSLLAKNFKTASGEIGTTVGELIKLSRAGELTTPRVIDALTAALGELQDVTGDVPRTIGASIQLINNELLNLAGRANEIGGLAKGFELFADAAGSSIRFVADNLAFLAGPAAAGAVGLVLATLVAQFKDLTKQLILATAASSAFNKALIIGLPIVFALGVAIVQLLDYLDVFSKKRINLEDIVNLKSQGEVREAIEQTQKEFETAIARQTALQKQLAAVQKTGGGGGEGFGGRQDVIDKLTDAIQKNSVVVVDAKQKLDALNQQLVTVAKTAEDARKAIEFVNSADFAFSEVAEGLEETLQKQEALVAALKESPEAYEAVKREQEILEEVTKLLSNEFKDARFNTEEFKASLTGYVTGIKNAKDEEKRRLEVAKEFDKFKANVADLQKEAAQQVQLNTALKQGAEATEEVTKAQEAQKIVEEALGPLRQEFIDQNPEAVRALEGLARGVVDVTAANEKLLDQQKKLVEFQRLLSDESGLLGSLERQIDAAKRGSNALEEYQRLQESGKKITESLTAAQEAGIFVGERDRKQIEDTIKTTSERQKQLEQLEKANTAVEGAVERAADAEVALSQEKQLLEAAKQGKEVYEQRKREIEAENAGREAAKQLADADLSLREKAAENAKKLSLETSNLQAQSQKLLEQERERNAEAERERKRREAEAQRERERREENQRKFDQLKADTKESLELEIQSIKDQQAAQQEADEDLRKAAENKLKDAQEFEAFRRRARKTGAEFTAQEISEIQRLIEERRKVQDLLDKEIEKTKTLEQVKEAADPLKKEREERQVIIDELKKGELGQLGTPDEQAAGAERVNELTESVIRLKQAADELKASGNPFAGIVEAAAQVARVTDDTFANLNPADKIETAGAASLAVLGQISETMKSLNIDNFEVQKGIALATATINAALAITKVLAEVAPPASYILAGAIGALAGAQIAVIAAQQPPERALGGPVVPGQMYRVGELGPEVFQSMSGKNYMIPGEGGNVVPARAANGNVIINNLGPPIVATTETDPAGNQVVTIDAAVKAVRKDFEQQMSQGYGAYPRSIKRNTSSTRKVV